MWKKLFGNMFADTPLFFKLWFGLCFGGAFLTIIAVLVSFAVALTDDKSLSYRAGESLAEMEQGFKDGLNAN